MLRRPPTTIKLTMEDVLSYDELRESQFKQDSVNPNINDNNNSITNEQNPNSNKFSLQEQAVQSGINIQNPNTSESKQNLSKEQRLGLTNWN